MSQSILYHYHHKLIAAASRLLSHADTIVEEPAGHALLTIKRFGHPCSESGSLSGSKNVRIYEFGAPDDETEPLQVRGLYCTCRTFTHADYMFRYHPHTFITAVCNGIEASLITHDNRVQPACIHIYAAYFYIYRNNPPFMTAAPRTAHFSPHIQQLVAPAAVSAEPPSITNQPPMQQSSPAHNN